MDDLASDPVIGCGVPRPCVEPPDPFVAVGPNHVVQLVNVMVRISDRNGTALQTKSLDSFFGVVDSAYNGDARMLYDPVRKRFVAMQMSSDCESGYLHLAVSTTNNPTLAWNRWVIAVPGSFMDFPGLGFSNDKIVLSANQFALAADGGCGIGGYLGASLHIVDWAQAISSATSMDVAETAPDFDLFTWRPAANVTAAANVAAVVGIFPPSGPLHVGYASISGTVAADTVAVTVPQDLTAAGKVPALVAPPQPRQPGSPATIANALDERPTDALWHGTSIYTVASHRCRPTGDTADRACVRVIQYEPSTGTTKQDFVLSYPGHSFYTGGIGLTGSGRLHVVFTRSAPSMYPSVWATWRAPADPANTVHAPAQLVPGRGTYASDRWGDYVGVATDPIDAQTVFHGDQYSDPSGGWATRLMRLSGQTGTPSGTVLVNGGTPITSNPIVSLNITWPSNAPVTQVRLSNAAGITGSQLTKGRTFPIGKTFTWDLSETYVGGSTGNGTRRVYAQFGDGAGIWSTPVSDAIIFDNTGPTVSIPVADFIAGRQATSSNVPRVFSWSGSDAGSGIDHWHLEYGCGDPVDLPPATTTWEPTCVTTYENGLSVRAFDGAGNSTYVEPPFPGARFNRYNLSEFTKTGTWTFELSVADAWLASVGRSSEAGATAETTDTGRDYALIASIGPGYGSMKIWVDDILEDTVSLSAPALQRRTVVFERSWPTAGPHKVRIEVVGPNEVVLEGAIYSIGSQ